MKKIITIISLLCFSIVNMNYAYATTNDHLLKENEYHIENVVIDDDMINFEIDNEKCLYDLELDKIYIGDDCVISMTTSVELVDSNSKFSEEELLELEKERIKEQFLELNNQKANERSTSLSPQVPANAKYSIVANFSKDIASIQAEAETALNRLTLATGVLALLTKVPYQEYLRRFSDRLGWTLTAASALEVSAKGVWKYQLHATDNAYPVGNTTQICFRYAHSALNVQITVLEGQYKTQVFNINATQNGKGGWWANQKPY